MKELELGKVLGQLVKNRTWLLVMALGLALLLFPGSSPSRGEQPEADALSSTGLSLEREGEKLSVLLSSTQGVGRAKVLLSHSGAVILCDGANSAGVRLAVTNAVSSYTGLGCDKIQVIKMK